MHLFKSLQKRFKYVYNHPESIIQKVLYTISPILNDETYLKLLFRISVGYKLNLKNPRTYNEKVNWLKIFYRDALLSKLADKYEVKDYVQQIIGEKYIIRTYGVWNSFNDINFNTLPSQFVLKTTHDSGGVVICKDKSKFDIIKAKKIINQHLRTNLYLKFRERIYKDITPRIIAEELLIDKKMNELKDYKFFCFNGKPKVMYIASGRQDKKIKFDFYDINFKHLDIVQNYPQNGDIYEKPKNYDLMLELARKLSIGLPHVRVDFYNIDGKIYFGEYTFFHHGGLKPFHPTKWDMEFGSWIDLKNISS